MAPAIGGADDLATHDKLLGGDKVGAGVEAEAKFCSGTGEGVGKPRNKKRTEAQKLAQN